MSSVKGQEGLENSAKEKERSNYDDDDGDACMDDLAMYDGNHFTSDMVMPDVNLRLPH
uniref:Uncharacterized protein n=1 Tax=Cajanus cajan TaxID=3821 RepID=A0A151SGB4_CAJCA|nr:hypothetical protein KK1_024383 [Cajanus cajan]